MSYVFPPKCLKTAALSSSTLGFCCLFFASLGENTVTQRVHALLEPKCQNCNIATLQGFGTTLEGGHFNKTD